MLAINFFYCHLLIMCFNASSSISSFLVVSACCLFILVRKYPLSRPIALIFFSVGFMQLAEFFIWKDQNCGWLNYYATKLALIILFSQPIILMFSSYFYDLTILKPILLKYILFLYIIFFGFLILWTIIFSPSKICSLPNIKSHHLIWDTDSIFKYIPNVISDILFPLLYFLSFLVFLFFKKIYIGLFCFILFTSFLLLSILIYFGKSSRSWKSLWCFLVNVIPFLFIIYAEVTEYFKKKKKKDIRRYDVIS